MSEKVITMSYDEHEALKTKAENTDKVIQELKEQHAKELEAISDGGGVKVVIKRYRFGGGEEQTHYTYTKEKIAEVIAEGDAEVQKLRNKIAWLLSRNLWGRIVNKQENE